MAKKRPLTNPSALYRIERRLTPRARAAFLAAVKQWQADVASGRPLNLKALETLVAIAEEGAKLGGEAAAAQIRAFLPGAISFSLTNPAAVRWAKENAARMISQIGVESRKAVKRAVVQATQGDLTTGQVSRVIRSRVGLTVKMNDAVQAFFERALEAGYSRTDALDEMYAYTEKLIRHRSEVIARTEVLMAENRGQELLWEQGKASGALKGFKRMWMATPDELLCPICGDMNGAVTEIGEPWDLPPGITSMDGETWVMTPQTVHSQCLAARG